MKQQLLKYFETKDKALIKEIPEVFGINIPEFFRIFDIDVYYIYPNNVIFYKNGIRFIQENDGNSYLTPIKDNNESLFKLLSK